jgi:hypothetical protein
VDHIVHRGGFIAGVAIGWILRKSNPEIAEQQESDRPFSEEDTK